MASAMTLASATTPATCNNVAASAVWPITFRWEKASITNFNAAASLARCAAPSVERTKATVSNNAEGPPASWKCAASVVPSLPTAAPILGAMIYILAPAVFAALSNAATTAGSKPSETKYQTSRPFSVGVAFAKMLNGGDGGRSDRVGLVADTGSIVSVKSRPCAIRAARLASPPCSART